MREYGTSGYNRLGVADDKADVPFPCGDDVAGLGDGRSPHRGDYDVAFSDAQWARLRAIFPSGVCNWSKRGYEQQDLDGTWQVID